MTPASLHYINAGQVKALLRGADILIFDEPLANLDEKTAGMIEDLLLSIRDKTVLIVSRQLTETKLHHFDKVIDFYPNNTIDNQYTM